MNNYLKTSYRDHSVSSEERPRYPVTVLDIFPFDDTNAESTKRAKAAAEKRASSIEGARVCMWRVPRVPLAPLPFRQIGEAL